MGVRSTHIQGATDILCSNTPVFHSRRSGSHQSKRFQILRGCLLHRGLEAGRHALGSYRLAVGIECHGARIKLILL